MMRWCLNNNWRVAVWIILLAGIGSFSLGRESLAIGNQTYGGTVDFRTKDVSLVLDLKDQGKVLGLGKIDGDAYNIYFSLRHVKFAKSDLSSDFYTSGILLKNEDGLLVSVKGKAWTQTSLLNFKPLKEFSGEYEITNSQFKINSFSWANMQAKGEITKASDTGLSLKSFLNAAFNITLVINQMELKDIAGLLGVSPEVVILDGKVSGEVKISGPLDSAKIEAKLTASDGKVARVDFKSATVEAEGNWPVLRFVNAQINDVGGVIYQLKGKFNLKELSDFNSSEHKVAVYSSNNAMRFQDWVIRRELDYQGKDMLEAEYNLEKNQALKMRIKDQEEILGLEKSVKF